MIAIIIAYIAGVLTVGAVALVVIASRNETSVKSEIIRNVLSTKKVFNRRGHIFMPPSEIDEARQSIIEKNREAGIDTPISELIEDNE